MYQVLVEPLGKHVHNVAVLHRRRDVLGRERWRYELYADGSLIFDAADLSSPSGASEDEVAQSALTFLTLRPGHVEAEYFDDYSPIQCAWRDMYAEDLSRSSFTRTNRAQSSGGTASMTRTRKCRLAIWPALTIRRRNGPGLALPPGIRGARTEA